MLFLIHWQIKPERRDAVLERFKKLRHGEPQPVKIVGAWHSVTQLEGWAIAEATDSIQIGKWLHGWTDLSLDHITPVVDDKDLLKILAS